MRVSALYSFALHDGERLLAQGRLSLLHGAVAAAQPRHQLTLAARRYGHELPRRDARW